MVSIAEMDGGKGGLRSLVCLAILGLPSAYSPSLALLPSEALHACDLVPISTGSRHDQCEISLFRLLSTLTWSEKQTDFPSDSAENVRKGNNNLTPIFLWKGDALVARASCSQTYAIFISFCVLLQVLFRLHVPYPLFPVEMVQFKVECALGDLMTVVKPKHRE